MKKICVAPIGLMLEFLNTEVYLGDIFSSFLSDHEITEIWCSHSDLFVILNLIISP